MFVLRIEYSQFCKQLDEGGDDTNHKHAEADGEAKPSPAPSADDQSAEEGPKHRAKSVHGLHQSRTGRSPSS